MIAMASNIGTGLFIATGDALYKGRPGSLMIAYIFLTLALTSMMRESPSFYTCNVSDGC